MDTDQTPDADRAARLDWFKRVRGLHRNKRLIGFAGVVLGAAMVVWWKLDVTAPEWSLWGGLAVLIGSWALFIFVIVARWLWVKNNPYRGP